MHLYKTRWPLILAAPLAAAILAVPARAADPIGVAAGSTQQSEARDTLNEAQRVVQKMAADPGMRRHLQRAQGLFVVPNFARGGVGLVAKGGEGVALMRRPDGRWSNPAFFNMGGVSVGLQAGASAGQVAFLLMTDKARNAFDATNNFSLNASAGLSIVDYSARAQASIGKGEDVIAWSDTEGLFAGANIGVSDIVADNEENRAFYGPQATAQSILNGQANVSNPAATPLVLLLPVDRAGQTGARTPGVATARMDTDRNDDLGPRPRADRN